MSAHKGLYLLFLFFSICAFGQKKSITTIRTTEKIIIDGKLDENIWTNAAIATDFMMIAPDNGKPIDASKKTEVKIVYDDEAVYIGAIMYDNEANKISKELTYRDDFATADHFGVFFNGYNDGQQEFRFFVSAAGVQQDGVYTEVNGEDFSWDAIWNSHVELTDIGWVVEMKIPYAALRFPKSEKQTWGINYYREIRRDRGQYTWSLLDNKINNESVQAGVLEGIENIQTPTRLFLIPYSSFYATASKQQKTRTEIKGGMDVKYGINDAFTLDAILIPDFGQTKFDNVELNLTAFEQQFSENRPFFTEGTDLFNKGGLLYSRRIGEAPFIETQSNETVIDAPSTIKLINALKVSGRTKKGLGIGVLNAVSEKTSVTIRNDDTGDTRLQTASPLTNYNITVFDQRFRKNSSISFVNTNVMRNGEFKDANVSALVWDLNTKANSYNLNGDFKYSIVNEQNPVDDKNGFSTRLATGKTSGKYRFQVEGQYVSKDYEINDLGINFQTHYHSLYLYGGYRLLNPNKYYNFFNVNLNVYTEFDNRTGRVQGGNININFNSGNKKNDYFGYGFNARPYKISDFYEPRSLGETKFLTVPESYSIWLNFSPNYNRKFVVDLNPSFRFFNENARTNYGFFISPRYRFNDHLSLVYQYNFFRQNNDIGFAAFDDADQTILGKRNVITHSNSINVKYTLNHKMNINLLARHYWSYVVVKEFLTLQDDGSYLSNTIYNENRNRNFNTWNLDLSYSWWFAPGSQMSILYRNNASLFSREFSHDFGNNFSDATNNNNLSHIFSISIRYFIDYNSIKRMF